MQCPLPEPLQLPPSQFLNISIWRLLSYLYSTVPTAWREPPAPHRRQPHPTSHATNEVTLTRMAWRSAHGSGRPWPRDVQHRFRGVPRLGASLPPRASWRFRRLPPASAQLRACRQLSPDVFRSVPRHAELVIFVSLARGKRRQHIRGSGRYPPWVHPASLLPIGPSSAFWAPAFKLNTKLFWKRAAGTDVNLHKFF